MAMYEFADSNAKGSPLLNEIHKHKRDLENLHEESPSDAARIRQHLGCVH